MRSLAPKDRLIAALDVSTLEEAVPLCESLKERVGLVKVGLELFVAHGRAAVEAARRAGHEVFLDLKLHDIPNTVEGAARSAGSLGARMLTVHASGGPAMIAAARRGLRSAPGGETPILLAVTVLTSLSAKDLAEQSIAGNVEEHVVRLARMAIAAGADGLVCSPLEVRALRSALGAVPFLVVPGVRPAGSAHHDQARVATPAEAVSAGADYLVVGRALRDGGDPRRAAEMIAEEIRGAKPASD
jgi:orotidine-5'-phosphate decarboxylase